MTTIYVIMDSYTSDAVGFAYTKRSDAEKYCKDNNTEKPTRYFVKPVTLLIMYGGK
jgi:hypothetical protein